VGQGKWYCFEVYHDTHVWADDPACKVTSVKECRRGRKPKHPKPMEGPPPAVSASCLYLSPIINGSASVCACPYIPGGCTAAMGENACRLPFL